MLIDIRPKVVKPPFGAQINWGHPLAANLILSCLANEGAGPLHDIALYLPLDPGHGTLVNPTWSMTPGGFGHTATTAYYATRPEFYNSTSGSALIILDDKLNVAHFQIVAGIFDNLVLNDKIWGLYADHNTIVTNGFDVVTQLGTIHLGNDTRRTGVHVYGFSFTSGGNAVMYRDGQLVTDKAWVVPENGNINSVPTVRALSTASGIKTIASTIWTRALNKSELAHLTSEPYAFLLPPSPLARYIFFGKSSGLGVAARRVPSLATLGVGI